MTLIRSATAFIDARPALLARGEQMALKALADFWQMVPVPRSGVPQG